MEGLEHAYEGFPVGPAAPTPQAQAWDDLARAAGYQGAEPIAAPELAGLINQGSAAFQHAARVYAFLDVAFHDPGYNPVAAQLARERGSELITRLAPDALASAVMNQTNLGSRKRLLDDAIDMLPPQGISALVQAAGAAYQAPLSPPLQSLVDKMTQQSLSPSDYVSEKATDVFRRLAHHMLNSWASGIVDTTTTGYETLFMGNQLPQAPSSVDPKPERIVQMALETGAVGLMLWGAVNELSEGERTREILGMLKAAPEDSPAATTIAQQFATPGRLALLLQEDPVDFDAVDALLRHLGMDSAPQLLDELIGSHSRVTRRGLLERVAKLGPGIGPLVEERLKKEERWFVVRNMLMLLREAGCPVANIDLTQYSTHKDPRVRREAMNILFNDPIARDRALANAFKETDPYMLRDALRASRSGIPDAAVPVLARRVLENDFPPEFRVPSLQLLGRSRSVLALDTLLKFAQGGKTLLGKPKLAAKSPELLATLRGLARTWSSERRARVFLDLAEESKDEQIMAAVQPGSQTEQAKDTGDDFS